MHRYGVVLLCLIAISGLFRWSRPPSGLAQADAAPLRTAVAGLQTRVATLETRVAALEDPEALGASAALAALGTPVAAAALEVTLLAAERRAGPNTLTVLVRDGDGSPIAGATVTVAVRMPAMDHGVSGYPAIPAEPGRYTAAEVSLGMPGDWLVEVRVVRPGRTPAIARYLLTLADR